MCSLLPLAQVTPGAYRLAIEAQLDRTTTRRDGRVRGPIAHQEQATTKLTKGTKEGFSP
jgi:hypothetical protein